MVATQPEIYVDGDRLRSLEPGWGGLKVTHRWPGGCWQLDWSVPVRAYRRLKQLRADVEVRCYYGATPISTCQLAEPNWDTGEMFALGLVRQGEKTLALSNAFGTLTGIPSAAVADAAARGAITWTAASGTFSAAEYADPDGADSPVYLNDLLTASTTAAGISFGVDARRRAYTAPDPTTPHWYVTPDSGALGITNEREAATVVVRYLTSGGTYASKTAGSGAPEIGVSLESRGVTSDADAQAAANAIWSAAQARRGWTNGLELASGQLISRGGANANLALVRAGQMIRLQGLRDERARSQVTDIVLGETVWNVAERTVLCNPIDMVGSDLASIIEGAGGELLNGN